MAVEAIPEGVVGLKVPDDRFRIREGRFLAVVVFRRLLEIEKIHHLVLDQCAVRRGFYGALIAAIFALDRPRHIEPAQLLDGVVQHAVTKEVVPGPGEKPECRWHMGTNGRTLRPRSAFPLATFHFATHLCVHLFQRHVADPLLCHSDFLPAFGDPGADDQILLLSLPPLLHRRYFSHRLCNVTAFHTAFPTRHDP